MNVAMCTGHDCDERARALARGRTAPRDAVAAAARLSKTQSTVSGPGVQTDIITLHREGVESGNAKST